MLDVYRLLAGRAGTPDALELAQELTDWHDTMVRHERVQTARGTVCVSDGCPHAEARDLWRRALSILGPAAEELKFLRGSAGGAQVAASGGAR